MRVLHWICLLLATSLVLTGCVDGPITEGEARATTTVTGCWPYGVRQPRPTPTIASGATSTAVPGLLGTATATASPTPVIYPTCTPIPGTPTVTPVPTTVPTPIPARTPQVPAALGGHQEIGDQPGMVSPWGRFTRSPLIAFHPQHRTAVVAYIAFGGTADPYTGDVWVRAQQPSGHWGPLQSVNTQPVKSYFGGLGLTVTPDGIIHVLYGGGNNEGDSSIYQVRSSDGGATWSLPEPLPGLVGRVLSLVSDAQGGLHLLVVQPQSEGDVAGYAELPPGNSAWRVTKHILGQHQLTGEMQLLARPDGSVRRFVLLNRRDDRETPSVMLLWSDDGQRWEQRPMELHHYFTDEQPIPVSLLVAPRGPGLIAVAWGQTPGPGHARSGSFVQVSTDGGATWGQPEIIAMHTPDGSIPESGTQRVGGFEPALVYEATTDMLVASWVEDDFAKRTTGLRGSHIRTVLSARALDGSGVWRYAMTADTAKDVHPPVLADWGQRGALFGTPDGRTHWLVTVDERNDQHRVSVRPLRLTALLDAGES